MSEFRLNEGQSLLVASRGGFELHGLTRWVLENGKWRGKTLARVNQLSSLARHPSLPVVYGTSRVGMDTYWHNRVGLKRPEGAPPPLRESRTLEDLPLLLRG